MVNIAEILKYCPKGMKLYSPTCGDCVLDYVDLDKMYSIRVIICSNGAYQAFTNEGLIIDKLEGAECLLFPSKNQRVWSKFRIPVKRGDIVMFKDKSAVFILEDKDMSICCLDMSTGHLTPNMRIFYSYVPASEDMKEKLLKAIDDAGYKWDGKNLIKKEHQFKPFDKVLVRDSDEELWATAFYSHKVKGYYPYKTAGSIGFKQCIPFEGNEHLVGTSNSPK
nr:MAG: hypothetical protein [Bacteriophage sp.]